MHRIIFIDSNDRGNITINSFCNGKRLYDEFETIKDAMVGVRALNKNNDAIVMYNKHADKVLCGLTLSAVRNTVSNTVDSEQNDKYTVDVQFMFNGDEALKNGTKPVLSYRYRIRSNGNNSGWDSWKNINITNEYLMYDAAYDAVLDLCEFIDIAIASSTPGETITVNVITNEKRGTSTIFAGNVSKMIASNMRDAAIEIVEVDGSDAAFNRANKEPVSSGADVELVGNWNFEFIIYGQSNRITRTTDENGRYRDSEINMLIETTISDDAGKKLSQREERISANGKDPDENVSKIIYSIIGSMEEPVFYFTPIEYKSKVLIKCFDAEIAETVKEAIETEFGDYVVVTTQEDNSLFESWKSNKQPIAKNSRTEHIIFPVKNKTTGKTGYVFNIDVKNISITGDKPTSDVMLFSFIGTLKDSEYTQLFDTDAAKQLEKNYDGEELLVDREHWSYTKDGDSKAYGWVTGITAKEDGCYATIRWTKAGIEMINNEEYKFVSGVWYLDSDNRPEIIESIGLTNVPRVKGSKPIPKAVAA